MFPRGPISLSANSSKVGWVEEVLKRGLGEWLPIAVAYTELVSLSETGL